MSCVVVCVLGFLEWCVSKLDDMCTSNVLTIQSVRLWMTWQAVVTQTMNKSMSINTHLKGLLEQIAH